MAAVPGWLITGAKWLGINALRYGPEVFAWLRKNPAVADTVQDQVQKLQRSSSLSPEAMRATLAAMREQVDYLGESADDEAERGRAAAWSAFLTKLEHAVELLGAGSSKAERKRMRARIDELRAKVIDAFLEEQIEDAGGPSPVGGSVSSEIDR